MERVKAHGFLSKTQAFLCVSPLLGLLLHKELVTPKAFTDEVRSPRLLRTRCKRIVQQLKRH